MGLYTVVWGKSKDYSDPQVEPSTIVKGSEAQELPLTSPPKSGTKIVVAGAINNNNNNNSDPQSGKQYMFQN